MTERTSEDRLREDRLRDDFALDDDRAAADDVASGQTGSILAADFGSVNTRVVMVDVVEGEYRLVARTTGQTTLGYPVDDASVGLYRIVQDIADLTGRKFFDANRHIITPEGNDRTGVDYFVTTASAGRPVRAVIVGLMPDVSVESAVRAVSGAYVQIVATLHLLDDMNEEDRLNAILLNHPDLIFIAGGTDKGAQKALLEILQVVRMAVRLTDRMQRPVVLYAGNSILRDRVADLFGEYTTFLVAENIRPAMEEEQFESALVQIGRAYDEHKERTGASFASIARMSSTGVLPTAQSYALIAEYFAKTRNYNVVAIDIGSASSLAIGTFNKRIDTTISTKLGVGHSAISLLDTIGVTAIQEWLPFYITERELRNYALNKALRPATIPMNLRDLYIEQAFTRSIGRYLFTQGRNAWQGIPADKPMPTIGLVIAGGAPLTSNGNPAYDMLLITDVVQPEGITEIKADPHGLIPALGAMAAVRPEAVVQLLAGNSLDHLGVVISISGDIKPDTIAAGFKLKVEGIDEPFQRQVRSGDLLVLPIGDDVVVNLQIEAGRGYHIGGQRRIKMTLRGGKGGIIFDARGRNFKPAADIAERALQMPQWVHEATEDPLQVMPDAWLETPVDMTASRALDGETQEALEGLDLLDQDLLDQDLDENLADETTSNKSARRQRRGLFGRRRQKQEETDRLDDLDEALFGEDGELSPEAIEKRNKTSKSNKKDADDDLSLRDLLGS